MTDFVKGQTPWNKGKIKVQDLNEIRTCKDCGEEKIVTEFVKGAGDLYRYKCKECRQKGRRTGIIAGRFQPGHPYGKRFEVGHTPWYKIKGVAAPSKGKIDLENTNRFTSAKYRTWQNAVKDRDKRICVKCGSTNRVAAHHIVPWIENEALRFEVENGITLCCSCHAKEEGLGTKIRP